MKPPRPCREVVEDAAATFRVLSAPARLELLWTLAAGERDVGELARQLGASVPAVSHHLGRLRLAGLVGVRRDGRRRVYTAHDPGVTAVIEAAVGIGQQRRAFLAATAEHA